MVRAEHSPTLGTRTQSTTVREGSETPGICEAVVPIEGHDIREPRQHEVRGLVLGEGSDNYRLEAWNLGPGLQG